MYVARYLPIKSRKLLVVLGNWDTDVKPEQMKVVEAYVQGSDMFAVLATERACATVAFLSYSTSSLKATKETIR